MLLKIKNVEEDVPFATSANERMSKKTIFRTKLRVGRFIGNNLEK